ncbi:MAG: hypothetical protein AAGK97_13315, partial [Bacteroidota bacterium]
MEFKNRYVTVFVILLLFAVAYFMINGEEKRSETFFLKQKFSGKIIDKFIDKKEHNFKVVSTKEYPYINISILSDSLFELIQVNDSIYKQKDMLKGYIYRHEKKLITIDYYKWLQQH